LLTSVYMIANKLKEIETAKARIAALEQSIANELKAELAQLPGRYGFESAKAFIKAVKAATGGSDRRTGGPGVKRRTRATITDEMRNEVKKLAEGGKTNAFIAAKIGISVPSVHNIKKAFGLVRTRK
jgi:DNA-binding NarL/FixJ family response regulator